MLFRKSALIVLVNVVGAVLGFVALKAMAANLGDYGSEILGSVGFALAIVGLFELIADPGINRAYVKRLSEGRPAEATIGTFRRFKLTMVCFMVAAVLLTLGVWSLFVGRLVTTSVTTILVALAYSVLRALQTIPLLTFEARRETAKSQLAMLIEHLVRVPAVVVVSFLVGSGLGEVDGRGLPGPLLEFAARHGPELLTITYVLGAFATLVTAIVLARDHPVGIARAAVARDLWRFGRPLLLVGFIGTLSYYVDRLLIGYYGDEADVGRFFAAQRLTLVLQIVPLAASALLFPTVSERHAALDLGAVRRVAADAERYSTLFVAPAIAFFVFLSPPLVNLLLSADFQGSGPVLVLLSVYVLVLGLFNIHVNLLAGVSRPAAQARASVIAFALNIALNLLFVPDRGWVLVVPIRGATGAALGTLIAFTCALAYLVVEAWRHTGKRPSLHVALQLGVAVALGWVLFRSPGFLHPVRFYELLLAAAGFFALYVLVLLALRELRVADIRFFWHAVHPRHMGSYVRGEIGRKRR